MNKINLMHSKRTAILIYPTLAAAYLVWRISFTLNPDQMIASVIFLIVDIITCLSALLFAVSLWKKPADTLPPEKPEPFSVDVFVPTYNETCNLVESTLRSCIAMDYPHKTYLLDDGRRPEMKALAEKLGAIYIARETNAGAKAGNINNAMQFTGGDLIAIFDSDFRPQKEFLTRLAGYFHDPELAIVQTPQLYYNTDSFQHRRISRNRIYCEQDTFMNIVLPARDSWGAAYWIGTSAILRRKAVEAAGGIPVDSVTEDVLASILIHAAGWKTKYVNEPLAFGLAPAGISEYAVQRLRWAKGAFQILRSHNPLFRKGLTFMQRLFYFSSVSYFFGEGLKTVYFLLPALFFLFGITPVYPYPPVIIGMLIYFGLSRLITGFITDMRTNPVLDGIYSVIRSFIYLSALPALVFNKNIRFAVTPKNGRQSISWRGIFGPAIILGFNLAAVLSAAFNPYAVVSLGILGWICFGWCLYTGSLAFAACFYCFEPLLTKSKEINESRS